MRNTIYALAALALTATGAMAGDGDRGRTEISLGGFTPWDADTRADDTSTWFRLNANFRLGKPGAVAGPSAYFEAIAQSGRFLGTTGFATVHRRRSIVGGGLGLDTTIPVPGVGWRLDAGAGVGLYFFEIADDYNFGDFDPSPDFSDTLARGVNPGVRLRAALRNRSGLYIEAAQLVVGSFRGLRYDGASLSVGMRF